METLTNPKCPECGSARVFRNGKAKSAFGVKIQRYVCRSCGRRFSDPGDLKRAKTVAESYLPNEGLKVKDNNNRDSQVCVTEKAKNLTLETTEKISVSQREKTKAERGIDIIVKDFQWQLKKEGTRDVTIRNYGYSLFFLEKLGVDLFDPETFKEAMARQNKLSTIRKHSLTKAYRCFLNRNGIKAELPKFRYKRKIPYIPPKEHMDQQFSHCSPQMAAFCFTMQATAARPIEALRIQ
jgi:predicted RNA-binding Zn-ribbon protein involved in translation (DUF1610 family)